MLNDKSSSVENMQIDPAVEANIKLQMSKEEFEKFMVIPIGNDKIKKTETLNQIRVNREKSYLNHPSMMNACPI